MNSFKHVLVVVLVCLMSTPVFGQGLIKDRIKNDPTISAGNYRLYPEPSTAPQKAPAGFKPVYMSHYGRHGSRWLIGEGDYTKPQALLHKMDSEGNLTELGKDVMNRLDKVCESVKGRYEELTEKGAEQHKGIATRMYKNYPSLFSKEGHVRAKSTIVIRCILSMNAATNALSSLNPKLKIESDASNHDMVYMNWSDPDHLIPDWDTKKIKADYTERHVHPERFMSTIFKDPSKADDSFYRWMFEITGNMQNTSCDISFYDLYTPEELYDLYFLNNTNWYIKHGNSPATGNVKYYSQTNLLRQIIKEADEALSGSGVTTDLRFGHDGIVVSVLCLMGLNNCDASIENLEEISDEWNISDLIPMGANLQMVFYQNKKGETLVSFFINEEAASLPIESYSGKFYRWNDVKSFWNNRLSNSPVIAKAS